jgi:hypothetical protein
MKTAPADRRSHKMPETGKREEDMTINRRVFLGTSVALTASLAAPMIARAQATPRVVVVGGGSGGATAAR